MQAIHKRMTIEVLKKIVVYYQPLCPATFKIWPKKIEKKTFSRLNYYWFTKAIIFRRRINILRKKQVLCHLPCKPTFFSISRGVCKFWFEKLLWLKQNLSVFGKIGLINHRLTPRLPKPERKHVEIPEKISEIKNKLDEIRILKSCWDLSKARRTNGRVIRNIPWRSWI